MLLYYYFLLFNFPTKENKHLKIYFRGGLVKTHYIQEKNSKYLISYRLSQKVFTMSARLNMAS